MVRRHRLAGDSRPGVEDISMEPVRRTTVVVILTLVVAAFGASGVRAKTPVPFDIEVSSRTVASGDRITVTIHSAATDHPDEVLAQLVGLMPRPTDDEIIRPVTGHIEVGLVRIRPGVFQGIVKAPNRAGEYVIVPYPTATAWGTADVFPDPAFITVNGRSWLASRAAQVAVVVGLAAMMIALRRLRSARAPRS